MDASVLALVRSLPAQIVKEQVLSCRARDETAVAAAKPPEYTNVFSNPPTYQFRKIVAQRFHKYCDMHGITPRLRMPHGATKKLVKDKISWTF